MSYQKTALLSGLLGVVAWFYRYAVVIYFALCLCKLRVQIAYRHRRNLVLQRNNTALRQQNDVLRQSLQPTRRTR